MATTALRHKYILKQTGTYKKFYPVRKIIYIFFFENSFYDIRDQFKFISIFLIEPPIVLACLRHDFFFLTYFNNTMTGTLKLCLQLSAYLRSEGIGLLHEFKLSFVDIGKKNAFNVFDLHPL